MSHTKFVKRKTKNESTNQNILSIPAIFLKHSYLISRASPDVFVDREDEHEDEEESSAAKEVPKVVAKNELDQNIVPPQSYKIFNLVIIAYLS